MPIHPNGTRVSSETSRHVWRAPQLVINLAVSPAFATIDHEPIDDKRRERLQFQRAFMTRTQVARRLHKSKSAIVVIEDTLFHPEMDPGDVRLLDLDDVEELAGKPLGEAAHSEWLIESKVARKNHSRLGATTSPAPQATSNTAEVEWLQRENEELRGMLLEHIEAWTQARLAFGQPELQDAIDDMIAEHRAGVAPRGSQQGRRPSPPAVRHNHSEYPVGVVRRATPLSRSACQGTATAHRLAHT